MPTRTPYAVAPAVSRPPVAAHPHGSARDHRHVGRVGADVLGDDEAAAQTIDGAADVEERLALLRGRIADDHGLGPAGRQLEERQLVGHGARQAQVTRSAARLVGIGPHPTAAAGGAERPGAMDGDDRAQPRRASAKKETCSCASKSPESKRLMRSWLMRVACRRPRERKMIQPTARFRRTFFRASRRVPASRSCSCVSRTPWPAGAGGCSRAASPSPSLRCSVGAGSSASWLRGLRRSGRRVDARGVAGAHRLRRRRSRRRRALSAAARRRAAAVGDADVRARSAARLERVERRPVGGARDGRYRWAATRFVSRDGRSTFVVVSLRGEPQRQGARAAAPRRLLALELPTRPHDPPCSRCSVAWCRRARADAAGAASLARGERLALPLTAMLLIMIFGSVVAALLPLVIGGLSIMLAFGILALLARVIRRRLRHQRRHHPRARRRHRLRAVHRQPLSRGARVAMRSATRWARAVATRGARSCSRASRSPPAWRGLLVFRQPFLRSVAFGGMAVVLLAARWRSSSLPALLALLGRGSSAGASSPAPRSRDGTSRWRRLARAVHAPSCRRLCRRDRAALLLGAPFARLQPSRSDVRAFRRTRAARVQRALARDFPATTLTPLLWSSPCTAAVTDEIALAALYDYTTPRARRPASSASRACSRFAGVARSRVAPRRWRRRSSAASAGQPGSARARALGSILHDRYTLLRVIRRAAGFARGAAPCPRAARLPPPPRAPAALVYGQAPRCTTSRRSAPARALVCCWPLAAACSSSCSCVSLGDPSAQGDADDRAVADRLVRRLVFVFQDGRLQSLLATTRSALWTPRCRS